MAGNNFHVLLADAHTCSRLGLSQILTNAGYSIEAEATCQHELERLLQTRSFHLLLVATNLLRSGTDQHATEVQAFSEAKKLPLKNEPLLANIQTTISSHTKVILLATEQDVKCLSNYQMNGIDGLLLKSDSIATITTAVEAVAQNNTYFSQVDWPTENISVETTFTEREIETMALLAKGYNNQQIAGELCLAEQTVRNYLYRLYKKLDVHSRLEVVVWAWSQGFPRV